MKKTYWAYCRACGQLVTAGTACAHLEINERGQAYQVHPQHQFEPDQYAEVAFSVPPVSAATEAAVDEAAQG